MSMISTATTVDGKLNYTLPYQPPYANIQVIKMVSPKLKLCKSVKKLLEIPKF